MCHVLLKVGARVSTTFPQATAVAAASLYQGFGSRAVRVYISVDGIYLCNLWTSICNVCACVWMIRLQDCSLQLLNSTSVTDGDIRVALSRHHLNPAHAPISKRMINNNAIHHKITYHDRTIATITITITIRYFNVLLDCCTPTRTRCQDGRAVRQSPRRNLCLWRGNAADEKH